MSQRVNAIAFITGKYFQDALWKSRLNQSSGLHREFASLRYPRLLDKDIAGGGRWREGEWALICIEATFRLILLLRFAFKPLRDFRSRRRASRALRLIYSSLYTLLGVTRPPNLAGFESECLCANRCACPHTRVCSHTSRNEETLRCSSRWSEC